LRRPRGAESVRRGTVWINKHVATGSEMPPGGVKGSGFGKDMSMHALQEHTAVSSR